MRGLFSQLVDVGIYGFYPGSTDLPCLPGCLHGLFIRGFVRGKSTVLRRGRRCGRPVPPELL